jgi:hypothetical protein
MEEAIDNLTLSINSTIEDIIPKKRPSPHSKKWWTPELTAMRTESKRLARISYKYRRHPLHPCHEEYKITRNAYGNLIKEQRKNHWFKWLKGIGEQDIWKANPSSRRRESPRPGPSGSCKRYQRIPYLPTRACVKIHG